MRDAARLVGRGDPDPGAGVWVYVPLGTAAPHPSYGVTCLLAPQCPPNAVCAGGNLTLGDGLTVSVHAEPLPKLVCVCVCVCVCVYGRA